MLETLAKWPGEVGEGWPSWAFDNHDAPRSVSRWAAAGRHGEFARMEAALLIALRGNVFIYQGQELALEQDEIPFELLQDPEAIANWPLTLSRDGVRTPMPWTAGAQGGFTSGVPWLPLSAGNIARAVAVQETEAGSQLHWMRAMVALRKRSAALRLGALENGVADGTLLGFDRVADGERVRCWFNLGVEPVALEAAEGKLLLAVNEASPAELPGYGAVFLKV